MNRCDGCIYLHDGYCLAEEYQILCPYTAAEM